MSEVVCLTACRIDAKGAVLCINIIGLCNYSCVMRNNNGKSAACTKCQAIIQVPIHLPGVYAECRTVNGITGHTGQCGLFGPLFHFLWDIWPISERF